jgi:BlaI family transcriptional regulator, penicillinase repressor
VALTPDRDRPTCRQYSREYFGLSGRERQIVAVLYLRGESTAREVHNSLPDAPSYSAVRATLKILERKEVVKHTENALRHVFFPAVERAQARRSALRHVACVFFDDSIEDMVNTVLDILPHQAVPIVLTRLAENFESRIKSAKS